MDHLTKLRCPNDFLKNQFHKVPPVMKSDKYQERFVT